MAASSSVSYNDNESGTPQALGHSIHDDSNNSQGQSGPAAVASFLASQFGSKK